MKISDTPNLQMDGGSSTGGLGSGREQGVNVCRQLACWPVIIFVIFAIILMVWILFTPKMESSTKSWSFFTVLIWTIIWGSILWFFCSAGQHAIAWFLLLLPLAIAIFWFIAVVLASATTSPQCVAGGSNATKLA